MFEFKKTPELIKRSNFNKHLKIEKKSPQTENPRVMKNAQYSVGVAVRRASEREETHSLTRSMYSPIRVSMRILSPSSMKFGTMNSAPVSTFAILVTFVAVFPRTAGSA